MAMTREERDDFLEALRIHVGNTVEAVLQEQVANGGHVCLHFTDSEGEELRLLWDALEEIGQGDRREGIRRLREGVEAISGATGWAKSAANKIALAIVIAVAGGVGALIVKAISVLVKQSGIGTGVE